MYGYDELLKDVKGFAEKGAEVFSIGKSVERREIYCFAVGEEGRPAVSTAAIHARENASAYVVTAQLEYALKTGCKYRQYFIPLVNPDGAEIVRKYIEGGDSAFRYYKANASRVDLNVNFDADWGTGAQNVFQPADENYVGERPFSEPESRALAEFTERCGAALTLSYHTMGREIYWYYRQKGDALVRDKKLAEAAAERLKGYTLVNSTLSSAGGYKDWCISALGISALTVELGQGEHPLGRADIVSDIALNEPLLCMLSEKINAKGS